MKRSALGYNLFINPFTSHIGDVLRSLLSMIVYSAYIAYFQALYAAYDCVWRIRRQRIRLATFFFKLGYTINQMSSIVKLRCVFVLSAQLPCRKVEYGRRASTDTSSLQLQPWDEVTGKLTFDQGLAWQGRSQDFKETHFKGGVSSVGAPAYAYICACALHKHSAHNTEFSKIAAIRYIQRLASPCVRAPRKLTLSSDALRGDPRNFAPAKPTSWKQDLRHGALNA